MSIDCSVVVWKRHFNGASRKMVAVKLSDWADNLGRGIWPSVETVATECDLSCRTVQRILSDFVDEGILVVVEEGGKGPKSTTRYDFNMAVVRALPMAVAPPDSKSVRAQNKGDTVSPLTEIKGDTDDAKGDTDDTKGRHGVTQTVNEPSEPSQGAQAREREPVTDDEEKGDAKVGERAFKRAFASWPTFVSDSEPAARKAWDGLATGERLQAIERQADYVQSVRTSGRSKFCTYGVYLAEKRWEKLAPKVGSEAGPKPAAPFGKAWIAAFLRIIGDRPGPLPAPPPANRWLIDQDPDREIPLRNEHRLKYGWPAANNMLEKLRAIPPRPVIVDAHIGRLGTDFQQVARDSAIDLAWDRLAASLVIPWLPKHRPEWIWLPPLPAGAEEMPEHELDRAVATAFEDFKRKVGHEHAA